MNELKYELLLAGVIAARASSFLFSKLLLAGMGPFNLLGLRFLCAFLLLALVFFRRLRRIDGRTLVSGMLVGGLFFLTVSCELTALKSADTSLVSLLENCAIILVPFLEAALRRSLPGRATLLCALVALLGVVCLLLQHGALAGGAAYALAAAAAYACAIVATAQVTRRGAEPLLVGIVQLGTMAALSLGAAFLFETPVLPSGGPQWLMLLVLVAVCSCFGFTLQPVAQSRLSAERAGLFCAINPAVATLLGAAFLRERIGVLGLAGLALILASIALPHLRRIPMRPRRGGGGLLPRGRA